MTLLPHVFNAPFWEYTTKTYEHSYQQEETDEGLTLKINLPGIEKQDISLRASSSLAMNLIIKRDGDEVINQDIYLQRQIDTDKITAKLELGVLTITAPSKNTDKIIQIT